MADRPLAAPLAGIKVLEFSHTVMGPTAGLIFAELFIPKIEQNPDLTTFVVDPLGAQGWLRPNFLHPPFNNRKARQALLHMVDQETYLAWAIGQPQYYRACYSVFACGGPYETRLGAAPIVEHDLAKARQLVQESGYDGQPIVVLPSLTGST